MPGTCKSWTILFLSFTTFALSITALVNCRFALLVTTSAFAESFSYGDYPGLGLFKAEVGTFGECVSWPDTVKDELFGAPEKVARAFGVTAAVLIGLAMVVVMLMTLILDLGQAYSKKFWTLVRFFFSFAILAQIATFAMFGSDFCGSLSSFGSSATEEYCVPGPAAIVAMVNVILLLTISIMSCRNPPPKPAFDVGCGNRTGSEDPDEQVEEDGTETPNNGYAEADQHVIEVEP